MMPDTETVNRLL